MIKMEKFLSYVTILYKLYRLYGDDNCEVLINAVKAELWKEVVLVYMT
jgi:hypothetical protein